MNVGKNFNNVMVSVCRVMCSYIGTSEREPFSFSYNNNNLLFNEENAFYLLKICCIYFHDGVLF